MKNISNKEMPELIGSIIRFLNEGMVSSSKLFIIMDYNKDNNLATLYCIEENIICNPYYFPKNYKCWELI